MSSNLNDKPCILVVGVGRSGTSFLTGALKKCGVYLGKRNELTSHEWSPVKYNLKGTWESKKILELQEKTYSNNKINISTNNKTKFERLPDPQKIFVNEKLGREIHSYVEDLIAYPSLACGFKFSIMLLNSWKNFLLDNIVLIGIFRHPIEVAESAKKLGWRDFPETIKLWKYENELILSNLEKFNGFLLNFNWQKEKLYSELNMISQKLGLAEVDFSGWYKEDLLHNTQTHQFDFKLSDDILSLYSKLNERSKDNIGIEIKKSNPSKIELNNMVKTMINQELENGKYFHQILQASKQNSDNY